MRNQFPHSQFIATAMKFKVLACLLSIFCIGTHQMNEEQIAKLSKDHGFLLFGHFGM